MNGRDVADIVADAFGVPLPDPNLVPSLTDRFEFVHLTQQLVGDLRLKGMTESQVIGIEKMLIAGQLQLANIESASQEDLMASRGNFQSAYNSKKLPPLKPKGIERFRLRQFRVNADRAALQAAFRRARQNVDSERQRRTDVSADEAQERLAIFRNLPDDFTLDDF